MGVEDDDNGNGLQKFDPFPSRKNLTVGKDLTLFAYSNQLRNLIKKLIENCLRFEGMERRG